MLNATSSGCINHPGVEAAIRCKQCGRPVCGACIERGPTGQFCSTVCRDRHQAFYTRAQAMEGKAGTGLFTKLKKLVIWLIVVAGIAACLGFIATIIYIPVLSEVTVTVRNILGI